ncbi:MAG: hypothetical protein FJ221_03710 [Lentisphaerae bacterium]|nr:hypothetical protein [Lentisphaerota bacterium]
MRTTVALLALAAAVLPAAAQLPAAEAVALRKEMMDLQFTAMNSAAGAAKREALQRADKAYRDALAKIPEFQAIEAERAALREKMKDLAQRQAALEAKYAAGLAPVKQPRDAAMQQLKSTLSGGARGEAIKARLNVIAPTPAAK